MLKTRVLTALVLLAALLPALFLLPPLAWAGLAAGVAGVAAWEWGGLMGWGGRGRVALGGAALGGCVLLIVLFPAAMGAGDPAAFADAAWRLGVWVYPVSFLLWVALMPPWLARRWRLPGTAGGLVVGAVLIVPTWLALVQLRQFGPWVLLGVMALVWVADIAAYFAGRAFGRRKLAPAISPGKTWAGAWGAVAGVLLYGWLAAHWLPEAVRPGPWLLVPLLLLLTVLSIVGDLFESLMKRQAGIKDSSNVLPGHGGVLDRIDSLTSTLPLVAFAWLALARQAAG